jgi:hypothetical protein
VGLAGVALGGLRLGVPVLSVEASGQRLYLFSRQAQLMLDPVEAPSLEPAHGEGQHQSDNESADHALSSKCGPSVRSGPGWRAK